MTHVDRLTVKIFADGANLRSVEALASDPLIQGFTTNPTLMRQAGIADYRAFAVRLLEIVGNRPVSFEVIADDFDEMERQAREIASWAGNAFVKIPITDTRGKSSSDLLRRLSAAGIALNVTAITAIEQVAEAAITVADARHAFISVFAGRIADTGRDPVPIMAEAVRLLEPHANLELLWASPRELLNIFQADAIGCHIITVTPELLAKLPLVGKDLTEYSLETVKMFHDDAVRAGYVLDGAVARAIDQVPARRSRGMR